MNDATIPYRDFLYPLNALMHVLIREEGGVTYLHYGLFEHPDERIAVAQERSTRLLFDRLPAPPARILDAGCGLGTTLRRLVDLGYDAEGINPDERQIALARTLQGDGLPVRAGAFETWTPAAPYDCVFFQESSQYIDSEALFARAAALTRDVIVLDEFSVQPADHPGALHSWSGFVDAAARHGFRLVEEIDLSAKAAPTVDYFNSRLARYRPELISELGLDGQVIDELIESGRRYRDLYARGVYGYRLARFRR